MDVFFVAAAARVVAGAVVERTAEGEVVAAAADCG